MTFSIKNMFFVYGYEHDGELIYIGKTNNLVSRFKEHLNSSGYIFGDYLHHLIQNKECPFLIIFGYHNSEAADELERMLIKIHESCTHLLNYQLREKQYKRSSFVKYLQQILPPDKQKIKIPTYIENNLLAIQQKYIVKYATETTKLDYPTTIS